MPHLQRELAHGHAIGRSQVKVGVILHDPSCLPQHLIDPLSRGFLGAQGHLGVMFGAAATISIWLPMNVV
jgi:hypothetical protein